MGVVGQLDLADFGQHRRDQRALRLQAAHGTAHDLDSPVYFLSSGHPANGEAHRAHRVLQRHLHRLQHRRDVYLVGVARRPRRGRYLLADLREERVGLDGAETETEGIGQAFVRVAVQPEQSGGVQFTGQASPQSVAFGAHVSHVTLQVPPGDFGCLAQPDYLQHIFSASAAVGLVVGAVNELGQPDAGADVERADTFGRVEFVPRHRQEVYPQLVHAHPHLAHRLCRVGVHQRAVPVGDGRDFGNRLDGADLVVGVHDGHQDSIGCDDPLDVSGAHHPVLVHRQVGDAVALAFEPPAGLQHRRVLNGRGDDVVTALAIGRGHTLDGTVIGLAAATGEDDFCYLATQQRRHLCAGMLNCPLGLHAVGMRARRVAEVLVEVRHHRLRHATVNGRRGIVVQVNGFRHHSGSSMGT